LTLKNTSSTPCTTKGFPGVSFLNRAGTQIGSSATRVSVQAPALVTLAPGADGYVMLLVHDPSIAPCAGAASVAHIQVYPPNSYQAALVIPPTGMQACTSASSPNFFDSNVGPVTATPTPGS